jgi:hypothetical protein
MFSDALSFQMPWSSEAVRASINTTNINSPGTQRWVIVGIWQQIFAIIICLFYANAENLFGHSPAHQTSIVAVSTVAFSAATLVYLVVVLTLEQPSIFNGTTESQNRDRRFNIFLGVSSLSLSPVMVVSLSEVTANIPTAVLAGLLVMVFVPFFLNWIWMYSCELVHPKKARTLFGRLVFESFFIISFLVRTIVAGRRESNQLSLCRTIVSLLTLAWTGLYIAAAFGARFASRCLTRDLGSTSDSNKSSAINMLHLWKSIQQFIFGVPVFLISSLEAIDTSSGLLRIFDWTLVALSTVSIFMFWVEGVRMYSNSFPTPSQLHAPETLLAINRSEKKETIKVFASFSVQLLFHLLVFVLVFNELRYSKLDRISWSLSMKMFFVGVGVVLYASTFLCWFCRFDHCIFDDFENATWRKRLRILLGTHNIVSDIFLGVIYIADGIVDINAPKIILGVIYVAMCVVNAIVYRAEIWAVMKTKGELIRSQGSANLFCFTLQQFFHDSYRGLSFVWTCVLRLLVLSLLACMTPFIRWIHRREKETNAGEGFTKPDGINVTAHSVSLDWQLSKATFSQLGIPGFIRPVIEKYGGEDYKTTYTVFISQTQPVLFVKAFTGHESQFTLTKIVFNGKVTALTPATRYLLRVEAKIPIFRDTVCSEIIECTTSEPFPDPPDQPRVAGIISHRAAHIEWTRSCTYGNGHPALDSEDGEMWEEFEEEDGTRFWVSFATENKTYIDPNSRMRSPHLFTLYCKPISPTPDWDAWRIVYRGGSCNYEVGGDTDSSSAISVELRPSTTYMFEVSASNHYGEGRRSAPRTVTTLDAPVEATLPSGWVECWDVTSESCYYFNTYTKETQWYHPGGVMINDPNLSFRKKRYRLLHSLKMRYPEPEGYSVLPLEIRREHILLDSFRQLHCKSVSQLILRTRITFEGETVIILFLDFPLSCLLFVKANSYVSCPVFVSVFCLVLSLLTIHFLLSLA